MLAFGVFPFNARAGETEVLHYTARLRGVALLDFTLCLRLGAQAYAAGITARTVGLAEFLVHGRASGHVEGAIDGARVRPGSYVEHSRLSGEDYVVAIDYPNGDPVLRTETPPQEKYRLPVAPADIRGAIDGLSAIALESLSVARTGGCDGSARVYDGRQVRRATTRTAGSESLTKSARSVFAGTAMRCDTESVMLAGFLKGSSVAGQARARHSSAWLAAATPGGLPMPVRVVFDADFLGDIVVDLDGASHTVTAACGFAGT